MTRQRAEEGGGGAWGEFDDDEDDDGESISIPGVRVSDLLDDMPVLVVAGHGGRVSSVVLSGGAGAAPGPYGEEKEAGAATC